MSSPHKKARTAPSGSNASQKLAKSQRTRKPAEYKVRWANVSNEEAAQGRDKVSNRDQATLSARRLAADTPLDALWLTREQKISINALAADDRLVDYVFNAKNQDSQTHAAALLASNGLDLESRDDPASRWSVRWTSKNQEAGSGQTNRVLYQWYVLYIYIL